VVDSGNHRTISFNFWVRTVTISRLAFILWITVCTFCIFFQQFFQDGARIEAAFRKYFYRAEKSQEKDSYEILVCHANVIRYFVCR
jgi:hypothetical protein